MAAFTDPKIHKIVMVAASQVGKSELELNIIGYIMDQDPGSVLFVQPSLEDARKFSRLRVAPMIRDSKVLKNKVQDVKGKDSTSTVLQKSFPGGMLTITGSNSASAHRNSAHICSGCRPLAASVSNSCKFSGIFCITTCNITTPF